MQAINKDYSPETAHLPSAEDKRKWRQGGRMEWSLKAAADVRFWKKWEESARRVSARNAEAPL